MHLTTEPKYNSIWTRLVAVPPGRSFFLARAGFAFAPSALSWSRRLLTDAARRGASAEPTSSQVKIRTHVRTKKNASPLSGDWRIFLVAGA